MDSLRRGESLKDVDASDLAELIEQIVITVGQSVGAITYLRRKNLLNGLSRDQKKTKYLLEELCQEELNLEETKLFGKECERRLEKAAKAEKQSLSQYLFSKAKHQPQHQPFRAGPSSGNSQGGRAFDSGQRTQDNTNRGGGECKSTKLQDICNLLHPTSDKSKRECSPDRSETTPSLSKQRIRSKSSSLQFRCKTKSKISKPRKTTKN